MRLVKIDERHWTALQALSEDVVNILRSTLNKPEVSEKDKAMVQRIIMDIHAVVEQSTPQAEGILMPDAAGATFAQVFHVTFTVILKKLSKMEDRPDIDTDELTQAMDLTFGLMELSNNCKKAFDEAFAE